MDRANPKNNQILKEYVLPDSPSNPFGRIRQSGDAASDKEQILVMNNERFTVPEIIFRPDDIGCVAYLPELLLC